MEKDTFLKVLLRVHKNDLYQQIPGGIIEAEDECKCRRTSSTLVYL